MKTRMTRDEYREVAHRFNRIPKKLTREAAAVIRKNVNGKTAKQQASEHGVHINTIYSVRNGYTWGDV